MARPKAPASGSFARWWHRARWSLLVGLVAALLVSLAIAWLPGEPEAPGERTDAIVVLTGGEGRVREGAALLDAGMAPRLFISGVHVETGLESLAQANDLDAERLACCLALGREARDTLGNAREVAAWAEAEGVASLRLVTSDYHMTRALLLLRRHLDPEIGVLAHPVASPPSERLSRMPGEIAKLLAGLVHDLLPSQPEA